MTSIKGCLSRFGSYLLTRGGRSRTQSHCASRAAATGRCSFTSASCVASTTSDTYPVSVASPASRAARSRRAVLALAWENLNFDQVGVSDHFVDLVRRRSVSSPSTRSMCRPSRSGSTPRTVDRRSPYRRLSQAVVRRGDPAATARIPCLRYQRHQPRLRRPAAIHSRLSRRLAGGTD